MWLLWLRQGRCPAPKGRVLGIDGGAALCYTVHVFDRKRSSKSCGNLPALYP